MDDFIVGNCPNCGISIIVAKNEINCKRFICLILPNGEQINPHASKHECETSELKYGCRKPFIYDDQENVFKPSEYES
jgi:hypothetical protein